MILILVLATWIVSLTVVTGLCIAAGRGDAMLRRELLEWTREDLHAETATPVDERRPSPISRRQPEHERAHVGRVAVG